MLQNLCVDNLLIRTEDTVSTERSYKEAKRIFANAFMRLRRFSTNDRTTFQKLLPDDRCSNFELFVLSLHWNPVADFFQIQIKNMTSKLLTKRAILSFVSAWYDSLRPIASAMLPQKIPAKNYRLPRRDETRKFQQSFKPNYNIYSKHGNQKLLNFLKRQQTVKRHRSTYL